MKKGYFLIEALLSVVIFSMLLLSIFSMISFLQQRTVRSSFESDATLLLQDGMEIAHSVLQSNWNYPDGVYYPSFMVDGNNSAWTLVEGEEINLEARYGRKIELKRVCRDQTTGDRIAYTGVCTGALDSSSREIITTVSWMEENQPKSITASLLVIKIIE